MEEVLEVYTQPHDSEIPLVCLDETSKQLVAERRTHVSGALPHDALLERTSR